MKNGGPGSGGWGHSLAAKERFAQEFAAHFLMPPAKVREVVSKEFGAGHRLSFDDVLLVKRAFGVSGQAMLRALRDLDLLSTAQFEDYCTRDPLPREREIFGVSGEECPVLAAFGHPGHPDEIIGSDRYKLLKQLVGESAGHMDRKGKPSIPD